MSLSRNFSGLKTKTTYKIRLMSEKRLYNKHTRVRSRWGAIANPHAKVFDSLAPHGPTPGHDLGNRMKILFNMFSIFYL